MTYNPNTDPRSKDARKLCKKYDKDIVLIVFIEKDPETKNYNSKARFGVVSHGMDDDDTKLSEFMGQSIMGWLHVQMKVLITKLSQGAVQLATKGDQDKAIQSSKIMGLFSKGNGNKVQ